MGGSFREFTWADTNMWLPHLVASSFLNKCLSMAKGSLIRWYVPFYHAKSIQTTLLGLCFTCSIMKQNLPSWSISAMPKVRGSIVHINAFSIFTSRLFDFRSDHHFEKHQHVCLRFCVKPDFVQFMWYNIHLNRSGTFILSDVRHHSTSSCESVAPKKQNFINSFASQWLIRSWSLPTGVTHLWGAPAGVACLALNGISTSILLAHLYEKPQRTITWLVPLVKRCEWWAQK